MMTFISKKITINNENKINKKIFFCCIKNKLGRKLCILLVVNKNNKESHHLFWLFYFKINIFYFITSILVYYFLESLSL